MSFVKPKSYRILIVDDDQSITQLLNTFLSLAGHLCKVAYNGIEAMEKLQADHFDAVITDVVMPEMDGITFSREALKIFPDIPIMIMTGYSDEQLYEKSVKAGAAEFITKPLSVQELSARFLKMMHNHEILCQIKSNQNEIEKISSEMIRGIQKESRDRIDTLTCEIEKLKSQRINS